MKAILPAIAAVSVIAAGVAGIAINDQLTRPIETEPTPTAYVQVVETSNPAASAEASVSATVLPTYSFTNVKAAVKGESGITEVTGTITGNVTGQLKLKASFIDETGKTVAVATGPVEVETGKPMAFALQTTDFIDNYAKVEVVVAEQL